MRTYVDRKLAAGVAHGHEIIVVAPGAERITEMRGPGARIEWLPAPKMPLDRSYRYFTDAKTIHALLDQLRPDMVEASSPWRAAEAVASWLASHGKMGAAGPRRWARRVSTP